MKKYFVFSDVHGYFDILNKALTDKGFDKDNPDHIIISCGDLLDRGRQPRECLEFVMSIPEDRRILVMGNHDDLLWTLLATRHAHVHDITNGTVDTVIDFVGRNVNNKEKYSLLDADLVDMKEDPLWKSYYNALVPYAEVGDRIFVHGWLPSLDYKDANLRDWRDAMWLNGMREWLEDYRLADKTVFCGHWHTSWGHYFLHKIGSEWDDDACFDVFEDKGIVALDACTAHSQKINVYTFETE